MSVIDTGRVFEIYSVGDGVFMRRVIDSVAAMSNTGLLLQLVGFGLLIGLLIMGFRNVMAGGQKLDLGTTLVAIILGGIMFGLQADVIIHDMNFAPGEIDQPSYRVDNVPFGIAAAGYLISGTGYALTEKMETGYGLYAGGRSTLIEGGFGNTLEWINAIRMWEVPTFDDTNGNVGRFRENLGTYINECTLPAIEMGHLRYGAIVKSPQLFTYGDASGAGGFGYRSEYLMFEYTQADTAAPKLTLTCNAGFQSIANDSLTVVPAFASAIAKNKLDMSSGGMDAQAAMEDAYATVGLNAQQMQDLVLAEAVGMSLHNAVSGKTTSTALSTQTKMMIEQASLQRATQWAAEETLFRRVMRPMMAFFESLLYGLAPFMAIMLGMGSFGFQSVMKYMLMSIWVILWLPMLSIIQLYQVTMMQHGVTGMMEGIDRTSGGVGMSVAGSDQMRSLAIDWLGSGAAMAAFTPALTMMLVWGGGAAASALAGRMQGGDHVNEKQTAPDTVGSSPAIGVGSALNQSRATGATVQDTLGGMPTLNTSAVTGYAESSRVGQLQTAQTQWALAVQRAMESHYGTQASFSATSSDTHAGGRNTGANASWSAGGSAQENTGVDATRSAQAANSTSKTDETKATASGGLMVAGMGGNVAKSGSDRQVQDVAELIRAARTGGGGTGTNANHSSGETFTSGQRAEQAVAALAKRDASFGDALRDSDTYQKSKAALDQAQRGYEQSGSFEQKYGAGQSVPVAQAANDYLGRGGTAGNATQAAISAGLGTQAKAASDNLFKGIVGSDAQATAGAMYTLYQAAQRPGAYGLTPEQGKQAGEALGALMSGGPIDMGGFMAGAVKPDTNAGMKVDTPDRATLQNNVNGNTPGSGVDAGNLKGEVAGALEGGSATQRAYANDVQGTVAANPGGYGPEIRDEEMAQAHVAGVGGQEMEKVNAQAVANAAKGATGLGAAARADTSDNTTVDAAGTLAMYAPFASTGPATDPADGGKQVNDRIEGMRQTMPGLTDGQYNYLAVAQEARENGATHATHEQYKSALRFATDHPEEHQAVVERYGREHGGGAQMFEDGLKKEAEQRGGDSQ